MIFSPGDIIFREAGSVFEVFKVLETDGETLVKSWWPVREKPVAYQISKLELRSDCELLDLKNFRDFTLITFERVSESELSEIVVFRKIQSGKAKRITDLQEILERADVHFDAENWLEAIHLYTEAASYARNNAEIFLKRGECFRRLGRESEANADFGHAESIAR